MLNRFFVIALTATAATAAMVAGNASAQQNQQDRCGPYATAGISFDGRATCTILPAAVRQQIIRARRQANAQRQRTRALEAAQQQRNAEISKTLSERDEAVLERDKALARNQRQPEAELKQKIVRRYWPKY